MFCHFAEVENHDASLTGLGPVLAGRCTDSHNLRRVSRVVGLPAECAGLPMPQLLPLTNVYAPLAKHTCDQRTVATILGAHAADCIC